MSISLKQVQEHNTAQSCWVVIENKVYDVTEFLPDHPGGAKIILKYAGKDATSAYVPIHPQDALTKNLPPEKHLGALDTSSAKELDDAKASKKKTQDEIRIEREQAKKPPLSRILNLKDMEAVARKVLPYGALAYFSSATDDELTTHENARAFSRFFFNPRVLRPVSECDISTTILGYKSSLPLFVSGAALAKLGHPLGEANITQGAGQTGVIQMVSSNASLSYAEIAAARVMPDQTLFFQFYKHKDDATALKRIREVERLGYKAIFLTVDAIVVGNRERDARAAWELEELEAAGAGKLEADAPLTTNTTEAIEEEVDTGGTAGPLLTTADIDMTWERTIPWLRSVTKLPVLLKGIQCVEDAVLAAEAGVDGILLSNHGGRQLPYSMPPIEVLYRIRQQRPDLFDKMEIYIDGGITRGSDVVKALCLGAKAVGLGRPFLYAQSAYGAAGVVKIIRILEREILMCMRLVGAASVKDLVPAIVERVDWHAVAPKL